MPAAAALMQKSCICELFAEVSKLHVAEFLLRRERQLEGRAFQMVHENFQIVRLNVRVLGRASEKVIGVLHDELVERRGRCDKDRA
jgi:hypothetical protein